MGIMLEGNQSLSFDLNKGPNRKQVMRFYARCRFLPVYCMQTFEKMFITGFFEIGISIFEPNVANPTLRYVAYKDAKYGDLVHKDIQCLKEAKQHEEVRKATSYALG